MNVLIDTNVLLSAALRDRLPEQVVLYVATHDECKWLVTQQIVREYVEVLRRPKFRLTVETLKLWSELLEMRAVNIGGTLPTIDFPRDPNDAPFLAAALATRADFLITGDKDLLQARESIPTHIVTVAEFAAQFGIQ